jgi:hypothetical protein
MHAIDVSKGQMIGTVSAQWAMRPDDQRFLDLTSLRDQTAQWAAESAAKCAMPKDLFVTHDPSAENGLVFRMNDEELATSHFAFGQVARMAGAPANYLRGLPAPLAAINLNYGLKAREQKDQSFYIRETGEAKIMRGVTSPQYGRIFDHEVADAVMKIAGNGTGDTRWKVPGCIDWSNAHGVAYNPNVDITKENTTLYASDRDVFLFLVDDMNPIEVGKLASGDPDLMFRGFYVWNSEVGQRTFGLATMYLRGVCQNRNLWGVEGFSEIVFPHTRLAPTKFAEQAGPALLSFTNSATDKVVNGVKAAKAAKVSVTDEERIEFLAKFGFSEKQARELIATAELEEGRKPENVWDHAQAVSAKARKEQFQENRLQLEAIAGKMLDKVS